MRTEKALEEMSRATERLMKAAQIDLLTKVIAEVTKKAEIADQLLYSEVSVECYIAAKGERSRKIYEMRNRVRTISKTCWSITRELEKKQWELKGII